MAHIIKVILLSLSLIALSQASCCGPNEEYVKKPNPCPYKCSDILSNNPNNPKPCNKKPCSVGGCQCKPGFVRDKNNKCIRPDKCPPLPCGKNEKYVACPGFCSFDRDCSNVGLEIACDPAPGYQCYPRCMCEPGYVRINGTCKSQNLCCEGKNQIFKTCPNPCPLTCENYKNPPQSCIDVCLPRGCECEPGYVRDKNNNCIKPNKCPSCKRTNEEYRFCGLKIQPTCKNPNPEQTEPCVDGCFCKAGYIRKTTNGECIKIVDCPKPCGENEEYRLCGPTWQATCDNPFEEYDDDVCIKGCFCKEGYVRESCAENAKCILAEDCCDYW